jgi:LacI family transcriptional regulator
MKKNNIKHISELAGVSTTAVSFVLNNRPGVSEKTRQKVLKIIEEENFTPNVNSRRLILKRSFNILVIIDPICALDNLFYSTILQSIISRSQTLGYSTVVSTYDGPIEDSPVATAISQKNADGLIFLSDINDPDATYLQEAGIPFVVVDSHRKDAPYYCVRGDYMRSAQVATEYLISCGHRDIAFECYGNRPGFFSATFSGFQAAMDAHNLPIQEEWILQDAVDADSARKEISRLLTSNHLPTAVLCTCDLFAIVGMNCAQQAGLRVPEDLSFCGIDDIPFAQYATPPLSTIHIPNDRMGENAVEMLNTLILKEPTDQILTIRSDELIRRQSVCCIGT